MQIQENISLQPFNTFSIAARARYFSAFSSVQELSELIGQREGSTSVPLFVLGGGSNILFTGDFPGIVVKNEIMGIRKTGEDDDYVYVTVGAGENWHQFVIHCIENNWAGVENLSLIPGCVGASPMQNIGAYGVEISEVFQELKAFHIGERSNYTFGVKECAFGYRESVFKNKYKGQFVILTVTFRLRKVPVFNIQYGAVEEELLRMGVKELSIGAISNAVIRIRQSKLPDPNLIGNAGSFFKNPIISEGKFAELKSKFPEIIGYPTSGDSVKLAAGWLIEHSGPVPGTSWKGFRRGDAGCHERQALVLVNYGSATGHEILKLSQDLRASIAEKFDVQLEEEVNIV